MNTGSFIVTCLLILFAYGLGSISGAISVCRCFSLTDPRKTGSKNPGATNVYRIGGAIPAVLTLVIDSVKGAIPVYLAITLSLPGLAQGIVALAAIVGHMYPVYYHFKGGKGVATTLGAGLVLSPYTTLFVTICWVLIAYKTRVSSIASISAAALAPLTAYIIDPSYTLIYTILSTIIIFRHKENISALLKHKEKRFDKPDL
ncbi:glycerol-3-phosphate 1-O-acyltransferase PlsY [Alkalimarinus sediminis]|uniref:Glycerol-3-phosphate acyltransferase n=1 Tax=Alkalimarinus sediminis TaxID=1632866 RepID=A0A9E8KQ37_9ALTE|nr:glycerol-3-phosphate 1-O-acyltransferase PlsY [Alkalimarinus sediminis]UZW75349.1 glycerol-3-phosphate 1-O-acyltransferase PlsY [Alkalimarinus sediminis]